VELFLDRNFHAHLLYIPYREPPSKEEIARAFAISSFEVILPAGPKIEDLRDFLKKLYLKPVFSEFKVGYIPSIDEFSFEAQTTLLKILEEPPPHTILVLTTKKESVLPTIVSRCRRYKITTQKEASDFSEIIKKDLLEQFRLAEQLSQREDLEEKVLRWLLYVKEILKYQPIEKNRLLAYALLELDRKLKSNANKRLALESFFIKIKPLFKE